MRMRHFLQLFPVVAAMLLVVGTRTPARAQEGLRCFNGLRQCYGFAARKDDFWDMWAAGLECEIDFAACVRQEIVGR